MTIEYHYAPLSGSIARKKGGEFEKLDRSEQNALMAEFLKLRSEGRIVLSRTEVYGHVFFHGHSGRVAIYVPKD